MIREHSQTGGSPGFGRLLPALKPSDVEGSSRCGLECMLGALDRRWLLSIGELSHEVMSKLHTAIRSRTSILVAVDGKKRVTFDR